MKTRTAKDVKKFNKRKVFEHLLNNKEVSKAQMAINLGLSLPTVNQIIQELLELNLVEETGQAESTGGRRAVLVQAKKESYLSAGIDITANHLNFSLLNLAGEVVKNRRCKFLGKNCLEKPEELKKIFDKILKEEKVKAEKILGLGLSFPGIIDKEQKFLTNSNVFELKNPVNLDRFRELFGLDLNFINDANAYALAEKKRNKEDFIFISLSNSVGGAIVSGGKILLGDNSRCGEIGHIKIKNSGKKCYCGNVGHYDPYGTALIFQNLAGTLENFFKEVESNPKYQELLKEYLNDLALMLYNLRILLDLPIILGGYVGHFLSPYLSELQQLVNQGNLFFDNSKNIFTSQYHYEGASVGAALFFCEKFLNSMGS